MSISANNPKLAKMASGGASKATTWNANVNVDPSQSGNPDQVQERYNRAISGKMYKDQLKKNKSGSSPV